MSSADRCSLHIQEFREVVVLQQFRDVHRSHFDVSLLRRRLIIRFLNFPQRRVRCVCVPRGRGVSIWCAGEVSLWCAAEVRVPRGRRIPVVSPRRCTYGSPTLGESIFAIYVCKGNNTHVMKQAQRYVHVFRVSSFPSFLLPLFASSSSVRIARLSAKYAFGCRRGLLAGLLCITSKYFAHARWYCPSLAKSSISVASRVHC